MHGRVSTRIPPGIPAAVGADGGSGSFGLPDPGLVKQSNSQFQFISTSMKANRCASGWWWAALCGRVAVAVVGLWLTEAAASTVRGRVVDAAGAGVPGVTITVVQVGGELPPWKAVTGADGRYALSDLLLFGNLEITPSRSGYRFRPAVVSLFDGSGAETFTLDFSGFDRSPVGASSLSVNEFGVSLQAVADPLGLGTTAFFEYGPTPALGLSTPVQSSSATGDTSFGAVLFPTPAGEAIHARLVVQNSLGRAEGPIGKLNLPTFRSRFESMRQDRTYPLGLRAVELDGDGRMDFVWLSPGAYDGHPVMIGGAGFQWTERELCFGCPGSRDAVDIRAGGWLDLDSDNRPDLIITSRSSQYNLTQFINTGTGMVVIRPDRPMTSTYDQLLLGDLDHDGRTDLVVNSDHAFEARLNQGGGQFITGDSGAGALEARLADLNGDGHPDLLTARSSGGSGVKIAIQPGDGTGAFADTPQELETLSGVSNGGVLLSILDLDGDGALDIVAIWRQLENRRIEILWNNGAGTFLDRVVAVTEGAFAGGGTIFDAVAGDFDNDGVEDLIVVGGPAVRYSAPGRQFHAEPVDELSGRLQHAAPMETSAEGRLHLLVTSEVNAVDYVHVLENQVATTNHPPGAPVNLRAERTADGVVLRWDAGTDDLTPAAALTWNIRAGSTPGGTQIVSPLADPVTGRRRVLERGNAGLTRFLHLRLAESVETIYWTAQAVDGGYLGGAWAPEQTVSMRAPIRLALVRIEGEGVPVLRAEGANAASRLWRSDDLRTWIEIGAFEATPGGGFEARDLGAPGHATRFYRATQ